VDAQRSRGLETQKGNLIKRVKNFMPVIIPLLVVAIRRALNVAEAMESRCFGASKRPTNYYELKIKFGDILLFVASTILFIIVLAEILGLVKIAIV